MGKLRHFALGAVALLGTAMAAGLANANGVAASTCGVQTTTVTATIFYDPFSANSVTNVSAQIPITRFAATSNPTESAKTQQVDFYFTQPTGSPAFQIKSSGVNTLYTQGSPGIGGGAPTLDANSPPSGTIGLNFLGASQPDTINVPVTISLPAHLDLTNGMTVTFGLVYECKGTGGFPDVNSPTYLANAVTTPVSVLSALQAFYAGPAMDFGNIQGATALNFNTFKAPVSGVAIINVRSSGPYTVDLTSENQYELKWGASSAAADTVKYQLHFLGRDLSNGSSSFATIQCVRAGISSLVQLPLRATLAEAAQGKTAANTYLDVLTVVVTPVNIAGSQQNCPAL
jgi:hypothetical protein